MSQSYETPMWSRYLALACSAGLLAIWTLPGTIALRHLFLGFGFVASLFIIRQNYSRLSQKSAWPIWLLALFYGWLLIHLAFFSHEFSAQLSELRSVWARSLVGSMIGLSVGLLLQTIQDHSESQPQPQLRTKPPASFSQYSTLILFIGLSAPSWIIFGNYLVAMLHSGQGTQFDIYQFLYGLYRTKPAYVIFVTLSLPLCFILVLRALHHQESQWWIAPSLLTILLIPFGGFFIGSKNAMVIFALAAFLFLISVIHSFARQPKFSSFGSLSFLGSFAAFLLIGIVAIYGIQKHLERTNSWLALSDNVQIGIDIDHHDFWKNREAFPRPINPIGQPVDISTYERTAWFTAGTRLLKENPLGYGLAHHSFGTLALAKWPDFYKPRGNLKGATHSGWLDLALGVGIPGVSIIFLCLLASWVRCFRYKGLWFTYASWTIPLILLTFLIAEMGEGHFLEILFFMTAFFCGLTLPPKIKTEKF